MKSNTSLSHTVWDCKYHFGFTVSRDEQAIREYIRNQEAEDRRLKQLSLLK